MYEISLPHGIMTRFPAAGVKKNALILCPGGGYEHCSIREGAPAGRAFARRGIETFVLRYDCAPAPLGTRPLAALSAAVQWVRAHAEQYGISPQRIAVGGFSAGAHLAGLHAAVWNRASWYPQGTDLALHQPNAAVLCYPVVSAGEYAHRGSFQCLLGDQAHNQALLDKFSIEKHIDAKTPPVFVWHTMTDDAVPVENTLMLIQACRAAGVSIEAHLFPEGSHGLSLANAETAGNGFYAHIVECVQCWPDLAEAWLRRLF